MEIRFEGECGLVLREYLKEELRISAGLLTTLKKRERGITVNGNPVTVRYILQKGDVLRLEEAEEINENLVPRPLPLDILYEDEDMLAVNKPPHMPTHPSHGHYEDTLANALAYEFFVRRGIPFSFRAVNRLDRDTSGVVLVAKNRRAASLLSGILQAGRMEKTYLAILCGTPTVAAGQVRTGIRRMRETVILREVCGEEEAGAQIAVTDYQTLTGVTHKETGTPLTLVRATPQTGRTHQLRLHFSHLGAAILGDALYGKESPLIDRQALHALSLCFTYEGREIHLTAPLPRDMQDLLPREGAERTF